MYMQPSTSSSVPSTSSATNENPFNIPSSLTSDRIHFVTLNDDTFFDDKYRQIDCLYHKNHLMSSFINTQRPHEIPDSDEDKTFVFFVDLNEVDLKSLQIDSLCPWTGDEYQKRSSLNTPFSIEDQRVIRLHPRNRTSTYKLHQYSKRHVGNPRLEKKTVYLMKEKKAFGIVMLMYRYCSTRRVRRENSQANNVNNVRDERTIRQSRNRPIFEQDLSKIPFGDRYVTVLEDRIEEIFDDDRIIDFMSNPHKIDALRQPESMNPYFPSLPPLISGTGCFVFFIEENKQSETKLKFADGLGDWRGNELQHPVSQSGKKIMIDYEEGFRSMFKKYSLRNARIDRLKKYIFYLTREGKFWKNIMIVYHYEHPGEIPEPVSEEMKKALLSGRVVIIASLVEKLWSQNF